MNLYARVKRGDVSQCSFGFNILCEEYDWSGDTEIATLQAIELFEVSVVTFPAYESTSAAARNLRDAFEARRLERKAIRTQKWQDEMKERITKCL